MVRKIRSHLSSQLYGEWDLWKYVGQVIYCTTIAQVAEHHYTMGRFQVPYLAWSRFCITGLNYLAFYSSFSGIIKVKDILQLNFLS